MTKKPKKKVFPIHEGQWANPREVKAHIAFLQKTAKSHGFKSLVTVGEMKDGSIFYGASRTDDKFKVAGSMIAMGLRLMGFVERED